MPKVKNYKKNSSGAYPSWVHEETQDAISIGPGDDIEGGDVVDYDGHGTPKYYQVTIWSRDRTNNRVIEGMISSFEEAKSIAINYARDHPDGNLIRTKTEEYQGLGWGENRNE